MALAAFSDFRERLKGGQVFDLRPGKKFAYRSKDVAYGLVAIVAVDGTVTVKVAQPKAMLAEVTTSVLDAIEQLGSKSTDVVTKAVRAVVGDHAEITTQPQLEV